MRFHWLIIATMILTSCATQQPPASNEPKGQVNNRDRDLYECEREAAFASAGSKQQVFDKCMRTKGYTPK
jgi:hypothetical protein